MDSKDSVDLSSMTVYELKVQCKNRNIRISGNKQDMMNRILGISGLKSASEERRDVLNKELQIITEDKDFHYNVKKYKYRELCLLLSAKYRFINSANLFVKKELQVLTRL
jgi:SAP domain